MIKINNNNNMFYEDNNIQEPVIDGFNMQDGNGGGTISYEKELIIQNDIDMGTFNGTELIPNPNPNVCSKPKLINRFNFIRKAHLDGKLREFVSVSNKKDPDLNLQYTPIEEFEYEAQVQISVESVKHNGEGAVKTGYDEIIMRRYPNAELVGNKKELDAEINIYKVGGVPAIGYKTTVSFSKAGSKVGNYKYIGYVIPISNADASDTVANFADLNTIEEPYRNMPEIQSQLRRATARMKCDGCGRTGERGKYYIFLDEEGNLKKFGGSCADRYFGINITQKLEGFMNGLSKLGTVFNTRDQDVDLMFQYVTVCLAIMLSRNQLYEFGDIDSKLIFNMAQNIVESGERGEEDFRYRSILKYIDEYEDKLVALTREFFSDGENFFRNQMPGGTDFKDKIKAFAIGIISGDRQFFKKRLYVLLPAALKFFFRERQEQGGDVPTIDNVEMKLPAFNGRKTFDAVIVDTQQGVAKTGNQFLLIKAIVNNRYGVMWYEFEDIDNQKFTVGNKITIEASTNMKFLGREPKFLNLSSVKLTNEFNNTQELQVNKFITNMPFIVRRVSNSQMGDYVILNSRDNTQVFMFITDKSGDPRFPNVDFTVGSSVVVTGTIKMSKKGSLYIDNANVETLNVQIAESRKRGRIIRLTEAQLRYVIRQNLLK